VSLLTLRAFLIWKVFWGDPETGEILSFEADAYCSLFVCIFVLMATASRKAQGLGLRMVRLLKQCGHFGQVQNHPAV